MKTEHFNNLTEAETERLSILFEECAEVVQICGKILRHGYDSHNPFDDEMIINRTLLEKELGHIDNIVKIMRKVGDVEIRNINSFSYTKQKDIKQYLHCKENIDV